MYFGYSPFISSMIYKYFFLISYIAFFISLMVSFPVRKLFGLMQFYLSILVFATCALVNSSVRK